jgi:hypothetical protein
MQVLHEIFSYLHAKNLLSEDIVARLKAKGFGKGTRGADDDEEDEYELERCELERKQLRSDRIPDTHDVIADKAAVQGEARGRGSSKKAAPRTRTAADIIADIKARQSAWDELFKPLRTISRVLGGSDTCWQEAAKTLARSESKAIADQLRIFMQKDQIGLPDVIRASYLSGPESLAIFAGKGPAPSAIRAMGQANDIEALGKYVWILRHTELADLWRLFIALKHWSAAFKHVCDNDGELIARHVRTADDVVYWAMVTSWGAEVVQRLVNISAELGFTSDNISHAQSPNKPVNEGQICDVVKNHPLFTNWIRSSHSLDIHHPAREFISDFEKRIESAELAVVLASVAARDVVYWMLGTNCFCPPEIGILIRDALHAVGGYHDRELPIPRLICPQSWDNWQANNSFKLAE